jgi:hypothetical protein
MGSALREGLLYSYVPMFSSVILRTFDLPTAAVVKSGRDVVTIIATVK